MSRQWKEGEKSMSRIITLYSRCAGGTICNDQRSLPLIAGGLGNTVSPPVGPGQGPNGVQGAKLRFCACYFSGRNLCLTNISSENG